MLRKKGIVTLRLAILGTPVVFLTFILLYLKLWNNCVFCLFSSNSFLSGAVTGGISEVGIYASGPGPCNDNQFMAMAIEPSFTNLAHIYVTGSKTNIKLLNVRLEGTKMLAANKPLVIIDDSSYGNVMRGFLGHTHVQADFNRNPGIDLMSAKSVGLDPAPLNHFWNAAFKGLVDNTVPGWSIPNNGEVTIASEDEEGPLYADHNVLSIKYLGDGTFKLKADALPKSPGHSMATFGIYAKSTTPNSISAAMRYESGSIIASASHSGSGDWEFIGMTALYDPDAPYFYFSITGDVKVTAPSFVYGKTPATPGASFLSSSGAKMSGTLSMGVATAYPPADNGDRWVVPLNEGNIFMMDMVGNPERTIRRLNYRTAERFPKGSVITLMFEELGTKVVSNSYIELREDESFVSKKLSSLTLMATGGPTWVEVSRN